MHIMHEYIYIYISRQFMHIAVEYIYMEFIHIAGESLYI